MAAPRRGVGTMGCVKSEMRLAVPSGDTEQAAGCMRLCLGRELGWRQERGSCQHCKPPGWGASAVREGPVRSEV